MSRGGIAVLSLASKPQTLNPNPKLNPKPVLLLPSLRAHARALTRARAHAHARHAHESAHTHVRAHTHDTDEEWRKRTHGSKTTRGAILKQSHLRAPPRSTVDRCVYTQTHSKHTHTHTHTHTQQNECASARTLIICSDSRERAREGER